MCGCAVHGEERRCSGSARRGGQEDGPVVADTGGAGSPPAGPPGPPLAGHRVPRADRPLEGGAPGELRGTRQPREVEEGLRHDEQEGQGEGDAGGGGAEGEEEGEQEGKQEGGPGGAVHAWRA